jgi:HEAT repeat protein
MALACLTIGCGGRKDSGSGVDLERPAPSQPLRLDPLPSAGHRTATAAPAPSVATRAVRPSRTALDPASVSVLKEALASKDYATRLIAVEAIGEARADALVSWLEVPLGDPEHDVRMAAVEALDRIHSPAAVALLETVRDDKTEALDVRAAAAAALIFPTDPSDRR